MDAVSPEKSPDRLDALVWALTELMLEEQSDPLELWKLMSEW